MTNITNLASEAKIMASLRQKVFPRGIRCPKCQRRYDYKVDERYMCKKCRYKFSFKTALGFKGTRLSWQQLWILLCCWLRELSPQDTEAVSGLSHQTIRRWYRRFANLIPNQKIQLKGIIEIDEAYIGKQRYDNQQIVLGALERATGQAVLEIAKDREQGTFDRFILEYIEEATLICTDGNPNYEGITEFFGYGHDVVNHSMGHFGITNRIENVWMRFRRFIKKVYHHVWKEHLPRILREFQARISNPNAFTSPINFLTYVFQVS